MVDPVETAVLHGGGILVNVPAPARYAVHKLIVSRDRKVNPEKGLKDRVQATQLIHILAQDDPFALREAYAEAHGRGEAWRKLLDEAVSLLPETARAALSIHASGRPPSERVPRVSVSRSARAARRSRSRTAAAIESSRKSSMRRRTDM